MFLGKVWNGGLERRSGSHVGSGPCSGPYKLTRSHMAVAQKTVRYHNGTLVGENMDQSPRTPSCLILSHPHTSQHHVTESGSRRPGLVSKHESSHFS